MSRKQIALVVIVVALLAAALPMLFAQSSKQTVCHKDSKASAHTITVASSAVPAHLAHGDTLGACAASGAR
jgi:hypothetical protein